MYTKVKNVQILIALMKKHGIFDVVISAGSRHVPFAQSVENDPDFHCYSVVDERSAGYFAIGLAKQSGKPVAIVCTSAAATCNYFPAVYEAARQNIPLLVLTADRHPAYLDQLEDQMLRQPGMYGAACRKAVTLPWITSGLDSWHCQRLVNEALLELDHHGRGPVQINFPNHTSLVDNADLSVAKLPNVKVIRRYEAHRDPEGWLEKAEELKKAKRIMILVGAGNPLSDGERAALECFAARYNCVVATEQLSNLHCEGAIDTYLLSYALTATTFAEILPEIVISFGGNFYSRFKPLLRGKQRKFRHWNINADGTVVDAFQSLTSVFESPVEYFFRYFADQAEGLTNSKVYYKALRFRINKIHLPAIEYSSAEPIWMLSKAIPENSLLHLSILNSTRIMELFRLPDSVKVYSNLGTYGIDGSMSTFLGQAAVAGDRPAYLVIGDLSFFYDMNCVGMGGIGKNVRIMLINNGGAAEFHFSMGLERIPTINQHIAAEHSYTAEDWAKVNGFTYLCAHDSGELAPAMKAFTAADTQGPVFLEVITRKEKDGDYLNHFLDSIKLAPREVPDVEQASPDEDRFEKKSQFERLKVLLPRAAEKMKKKFGKG